MFYKYNTTMRSNNQLKYGLNLDSCSLCDLKSDWYGCIATAQEGYWSCGALNE